MAEIIYVYMLGGFHEECFENDYEENPNYNEISQEKIRLDKMRKRIANQRLAPS